MDESKMTSSENAAFNRCAHCLLELIIKYGPAVRKEEAQRLEKLKKQATITER